MKWCFVLFVFAVTLGPLKTLAMKTVRTVDNVELQWVLCEPSVSTVFSKLDIKPGKALNRSVYYSETQDMDLYRGGAILRTRVSEKKIKTAAKLKDFHEAEIPWNFLNQTDYKCELDSYVGHASIGCSIEFNTSSMDHLRSSLQEEFITVRTGFNDFNRLQTLGPALSQEWKWHDSLVDEDIVVESVQIPFSSFLSLELSVRVPLAQKQKTFQHIQTWLQRHQVELCQKQEGRTGALLQTLLKQN